MALPSLVLSPGFRLLGGALRVHRRIELGVGGRGPISSTSVCVAPHELLLGQGPCSVGEPWRESREFHWPGGPPQIMKYVVLVLRGNGVRIENNILNVGL